MAESAIVEGGRPDVELECSLECACMGKTAEFSQLLPKHSCSLQMVHGHYYSYFLPNKKKQMVCIKENCIQNFG